jgi:integrase
MNKPVASLRKDKRWEAKGIDPSTGARKSYYGQSQAEAEKKALNSYGVSSDGTLYSFYANVYLPTVAHRSENWIGQIAWAMDGYVLPEFGNVDLCEIDRKSAQRFFNRLLGLMKVSSVRKIRIVFSGVMNLAEDDELISRNPVRKVRLPAAEKPDKKALTFEQLWTLLEHAQPRAVPVILLEGFCSLRLGESVAVTRAHLPNGVLQVRQQALQLTGGCRILDKLKNPQSERDIPLPAPLLDRLLNAGQVSGIYVCSDSKGGYLTPNNATRELAEACERAGLGHYEDRSGKQAFIPMVTPHELRHTFISLMENEIEAPPAIVACLAGKSYGGPNKGYSHTHRKQLERWMQKFWDQASTSLTTKSVVKEA